MLLSEIQLHTSSSTPHQKSITYQSSFGVFDWLVGFVLFCGVVFGFVCLVGFVIVLVGFVCLGFMKSASSHGQAEIWMGICE